MKEKMGGFKNKPSQPSPQPSHLVKRFYLTTFPVEINYATRWDPEKRSEAKRIRDSVA